MKPMLSTRKFLLTAFLGTGCLCNQAHALTVPCLQDSIIIQKQNSSKQHNISIYTNASQQVLFFSARGEEGKVYQLLLFRQEGKLIKTTRIRNRETTVVSKPEKGNYFFEVFSDATKLESGTITVL